VCADKFLKTVSCPDQIDFTDPLFRSREMDSRKRKNNRKQNG
jgi:hypothetical protein